MPAAWHQPQTAISCRAVAKGAACSLHGANSNAQMVLCQGEWTQCPKWCSALQYATWEEAQKDFRRARSVWERALEVSYTSVSLWLKYAEMEMRHW